MTGIPTARTAAPGTGHEHDARLGGHFWRHFAEMLGVMVAGMIASVAVLLTILQVTWEQATVDYPTASLLVVAAGMTIPMAMWMLHRGMGRKNTLEMAAAMALPVVPFLCLVWLNITSSAQCGAYCLLSIVAMVVLMVHRHDEYSMTEAHSR